MHKNKENYLMMMETLVTIVPYSPPLLVTRMPMCRPALPRPPRPLKHKPTAPECPGPGIRVAVEADY